MTLVLRLGSRTVWSGQCLSATSGTATHFGWRILTPNFAIPRGRDRATMTLKNDAPEVARRVHDWIFASCACRTIPKDMGVNLGWCHL